MTDHLIDLPLTRETLETVADPTQVHRLLTSYLPQLHGRSTSIRADTGTQLRVDLPTDPLGHPGVIRLRLRSDALAPGTGTATPTPDITTGTRIIALVSAERRRTDDRGIRVRPVTDDTAHAWAAQLLERHGMTATDLAISPPRRYGTPPGVRFTVRDLAATVTVTNPTQVAHALTCGIGHGRAYGLGMIVPIPTDPGEPR